MGIVAVAWDSSRTRPANIPHATAGSHLKCTQYFRDFASSGS